MFELALSSRVPVTKRENKEEAGAGVSLWFVCLLVLLFSSTSTRVELDIL